MGPDRHDLAWLALAAAAGLAACAGDVGDDDPAPASDDDTTALADDDVTPAPDDDATAPGDDDATPAPDDDATAPDDDATPAPDDDTTEPGDDDATPAPDDDTSPADDDGTPPPDPPPDLRVLGPGTWTESEGSFPTSSGCDVSYDRFVPVAPLSSTAVMLSHGLERDSDQMVDWARHFASWGIEVVTPDQCRCTVLDLDQHQNGLDSVELAAALGLGPVIYAGHSAGGLAAFVSAANDPGAVAMLGLDPTEWLGIGADAEGSIHTPAYGLIGSPGVCNVGNNFLSLYDDLPDSRAIRVTEADHCDFERPTDWVCQLPCGTGSNDLFSDPQIQETILGLSTAFLRWQAGVDSHGPEWWEPGGTWYDALAAAGAISEP